MCISVKLTKNLCHNLELKVNIVREFTVKFQLASAVDKSIVFFSSVLRRFVSKISSWMLYDRAIQFSSVKCWHHYFLYVLAWQETLSSSEKTLAFATKLTFSYISDNNVFHFNFLSLLKFEVVLGTHEGSLLLLNHLPNLPGKKYSALTLH